MIARIIYARSCGARESLREQPDYAIRQTTHDARTPD